MPARPSCWVFACLAVVSFAMAWFRTSAAPADKPEAWVEAAAPHFTVISNDGEKTARRIAQQFEQIRILYSKALSQKLRLDPGVPIVIIAAKNEKSLSQIIPEYWAQKGHTHPAGIFLPGAEKNYIALRTDVEGEFPYLTIYHEYVHLIVNLNFQHFPVWLNEGYATFLGSAVLHPTSGEFGKPNESELYVLQQTKLLPLDVLFGVGQDSPYYNEAEKTNVFYAQSWALVHYLMMDASRKKDSQLGKYMNLTENGDDPVEAAKSAFGDLGRLKKDLDSYVSRTAYTMFTVDLPGATDPKSFQVRIVPTAEVDATLGEFDIGRRQLETARPKIEEALRLDPNSPAAQESMGLLLFREDKRTEAQKYFSRAVTLDSKSALTYFYDGMLLLSGGAEQEDTDEAQTALEKAVALKPELAPAWDALARLYVSDPQSLDKAMNAAIRAVKAMPGEPGYRFNLAIVLLKMGKFDDARTIVQGVGKSGDKGLASRAQQFLEQIDRAQQFNSGRRIGADDAVRPEIAQGVKGVEPTELGRPPHQLTRRAGEQSAPSANASGDPAPSTSSAAGPPANVNSTRAYSMVGAIATVNCLNAPQIQITLQSGFIAMRLHSTDFATIEIKAGAGTPSSSKPSCRQLEGKKARISYQLVSGKPWDGEIGSIEFQNTP
jgi:tetratricopeptide (TPR) repeat protein